jgi:hypothetical protein
MAYPAIGKEVANERRGEELYPAVMVLHTEDGHFKQSALCFTLSSMLITTISPYHHVYWVPDLPTLRVQAVEWLGT